MKRVFFDGKYPLAKLAVNKIKKLDTKDQFTFSSLDGKKSKGIFQGNYTFLRKNQYVVFLEGNRVWVKANAILRLFWLTGGYWKILGAFCFIPGFIVNPIFRLCSLFVRK